MNIKASILRLKRRFILNSIGSFYSSGDYALVTKHAKRPFSLRRREEALSNIFRILSLKKLNQPEWKKEFAYLVEKNFLELFNSDEREYLNQILHLELFGEYNSFTQKKINVENLSKTIRSYLLEDIGDT